MKTRPLFAGVFLMALFFSCGANKSGTVCGEKLPVKIWAHRGASGRHPENTLEAFDAALGLPGLCGIELDIQLTKDGELVVIHDETVDRTTNGTGAVHDWTLKDLKKLKIKSASKNPFKRSRGERIPTMRDVLKLTAPRCKARGIFINIELKNSRVRYEGMEEKILSLVKEFGMEENVVYSTFNQESVVLLKKLDPSVKVGILNGSSKVCLDFAAKNPVDALHPHIRRLDDGGLLLGQELPVRAWGSMESFFPKKYECEVHDLERLRGLGVTDIFTNVPEEYLAALPRQTPLLELNKAFNYESGIFESREGPFMADFRFYEVNAGDKILCLDKDWLYQAAFYNDKIDPAYIHTYCYSPQESWATFEKNIGEDSWKDSETVFDRHGWVRLAVKKRAPESGNALAERADIRAAQSAVRLVRAKVLFKAKSCFDMEIEDTAKKVLALKDADTLVLGLVTDNHYVINGRWEDTANNLREVNKRAQFDALVHLGDFTDGMTPLEITKEYFGLVHRDLKKLGVPLYYCLGNHDSNYFRKNPQSIGTAEQSRLYLQREEPHYYVDFADKNLRVLFLHSYDHTQEGQGKRYGFDDGEVEWVRKKLAETPAAYKVLVFSHVPLLAKMHFWSDEIRNEAAMVKVLEDFNAGITAIGSKTKIGADENHTQAQDADGGSQGHKGRLLAFVHGHIHADWVNDTDLSFPVVSIGCAKIEDEQVKKSAGSTTYSRALDDASQELWDVLLVNARAGRLDFVRFGAGEDRRVGE